MPGTLNSTTISVIEDLSNVSALPLLSENVVFELLINIARGLINIFSYLLINLIQLFLFFPNPSTISALDNLWYTSLTVFLIIWFLLALSYLASLEIFPNNENITPWRFIERSLIAIIAIILSRPALALSVELVEIVGRYIYPLQFALSSGAGFESAIGGVSSGAAFIGGLIAIYSGGTGILVSFLGILTIRALMVYTVYATFPIWMGLWIVDEGPLKYGHMVSKTAFKAFAMLLLAGIMISAILATGGAIAAHDPNGGSSAPNSVHESTSLYESDTTLHQSQAPLIQQPSEGGSASLAERHNLALSIIAIFGSLGASFAITSTTLGMLISIGSSATARSGDKLQRSAPVGGANTESDYGKTVGGSEGQPVDDAVTPGSHGHGPGEGDYVSSETLSQGGDRSLTEQAKMGYEKTKDNLFGDDDPTDSTAETGSFDPDADFAENYGENSGGDDGDDDDEGSAVLSGISSGLSTVYGGAKTTAGAVDKTGKFIAQNRDTSIRQNVHRSANYMRKNPVVGGRKSSYEQLHDEGASFITKTEDGEFKFDGGLEDIPDIGYHPENGEFWEEANLDQEEVFESFDGEHYRAYRSGKKDHVIVANADGESDFRDNVEMKGASRYALADNTDLESNTPFAMYDESSDVVVVAEKQGRSLTEIQQDSDLDVDDIDPESYLDEVASSIITGDERGAKGEVLFDRDGKAFNPTVDTEQQSFTKDELDDLAEEAAESGIVTEEQVKERVKDATNQLEEEYDSIEDYGEHAKNMTSNSNASKLKGNLSNVYSWSRGRSRTKG